MKCMGMSLKVFQKHLNSTQIFQKQYFQNFFFCPQNLNIKHILHQNQGITWMAKTNSHTILCIKFSKK